jgi:uncharacterized repeat protein (TIGR03803 family)
MGAWKRTSQKPTSLSPLLFTTLIAAWASMQSSQIATAATPPSQIILQVTPLGPATTNILDLSITPDGAHCALAANAGSRRAVFIDGNEGAPCSDIAQMPSLGHGAAPRLIFGSPDGTRFAYVASKGSDWVMVINQKEGPAFDRINAALFSPVGHRLAYIATKAGKQQVVVDSFISNPYQNVPLSESQFSSDAQHFGFVAQSDPSVPSWHAVVDGKEGPAFTQVKSLQLAGSHVAYIANTGNLYDNLVVVDGKPGPKFADIRPPVLSDDGTHVAYVATTTSRNPITFTAVIDGQPGPEFAEATNVTFSPDGKHSIYIATDIVGARSTRYAIVDGNKSLDYQSCTGYVFSPDSQHIAYIATSSNNKSVVVLDGKESDAHDEILSLTFSPDSKRLACIAHDQNKMTLIIDGKPGPACPAIDPRSVQFTADSQHCLYKVQGNSGQWTCAMDDIPSDPAAPVSDKVSTPDGQHSATVICKGAGTGSQTAQVFLDQKPIGQTYVQIQQLQISADGNHVAFIGQGAGEPSKTAAHAVIDGHENPGYFRIDKIVLSPDGQHMAYDATNGPKHFVIVDSFQGPEYDDVVLGITQQGEAMLFRPDGSLSFLASMGGKLNHVVLTPDAIAAIPKSAAAAGSGASAASAPAGYSKVYTMGGIPKDGSLPAVLTAAPDGTLYGGTNGGGKYQMGILFKCAADGSGYTILHNFAGGHTDGMRPTSIFVGPDGAIYGSTLVQGESGNGTIFRCAADGSGYKTLHAFTGSDKDGAAPTIEAIEPDGTICGISGHPGQSIYIFRMKPDGSEINVVFDANKAPGGLNKNPLGRFTDGGDGYYYGSAGRILFKIKKDGTGYLVLKKFDGAPTDADYAEAAPILGSDGNLYGVDRDGGQARGGTAFTLARDGSAYKLILDPDPGPDQLMPTTLAEGSDGKLYALVHAGLARFNKDGSGYEVLYPMTNGGGFPWTAFVHGGAFYCAADEGPNRGTIFRFGFGGGGGGSGGGPAAPTVEFQTISPPPIDTNIDLPADSASPS